MVKAAMRQKTPTGPQAWRPTHAYLASTGAEFLPIQQ